MRKLGDDIYIQRGETWSLDFQVENERGDPYMLLKEWKNPYLAITVTAARYEQEGDFRTTWWLDLNQRWVEDKMGDMSLVPIKKFVSTEALPVTNFTIADILDTYGVENGGNIVVDKDSDFDITNYLFFTDPNMDNNRIYKYLANYDIVQGYYARALPWSEGTAESYGNFLVYGGGNGPEYYVCIRSLSEDENMVPPSEASGGVGTTFTKITDTYIVKAEDNAVYVTKTFDTDTTYYLGDIYYYEGALRVCNVAVAKGNAVNSAGNFVPLNNSIGDTRPTMTNEKWEDYDFRIIKAFATKDWVEQTYLYDIKILAGESLEERVQAILTAEGDDVPDLPWSREELQEQINLIGDKEMRTECQYVYDTGMPLMPDFDTKALILLPSQLIVSANIQGGSKVNAR